LDEGCSVGHENGVGFICYKSAVGVLNINLNWIAKKADLILKI